MRSLRSPTAGSEAIAGRSASRRRAHRHRQPGRRRLDHRSRCRAGGPSTKALDKPGQFAWFDGGRGAHHRQRRRRRRGRRSRGPPAAVISRNRPRALRMNQGDCPLPFIDETGQPAQVDCPYELARLRKFLQSADSATSLGQSPARGDDRRVGPVSPRHASQQAPIGEGQTAAFMCPMHPDVMSASPGKCPRCNMDLVPAPTSAYVCPMHPDVMSATPGKCPRCNMDLVAGSPITMPDFDLHVETTPRVRQGRAADKFTFIGAPPADRCAGERLRDVHDKLFHLFVVSRDMRGVRAHAPASITPTDRSPSSTRCRKPGHYVLFSDFLAWVAARRSRRRRS